MSQRRLEASHSFHLQRPVQFQLQPPIPCAGKSQKAVCNIKFTHSQSGQESAATRAICQKSQHHWDNMLASRTKKKYPARRNGSKCPKYQEQVYEDLPQVINR